jgi:L-asparagine transporter-like permease
MQDKRSAAARVNPLNCNIFKKPIYKLACEKPAMSWIITLAFFGLCCWFAKRARERAEERAPSGMLRSPLYWWSNALTLGLLALVLYIARTHHQSPVSPFVWFTVLAIIVALMLIRRALKWRYPV